MTERSPRPQGESRIQNDPLVVQRLVVIVKENPPSLLIRGARALQVVLIRGMEVDLHLLDGEPIAGALQVPLIRGDGGGCLTWGTKACPERSGAKSKEA